MFKKLITFCVGLMCFASLQAQTESTINSSDILYWVGQGDNTAILVVDFGTNAYAWGYRYEDADEATALDMIMAVDEADPRLAYSMNWVTYDFDFFYVEYPQKLMATSDQYRFKVNGVMAEDDDEFSDYDLADGMVVKVSTSADDVWSTEITAATVSTMPQFSTIDRNNIEFWAGEGEFEATVVVYWSNPTYALAWGYRFDAAPTVSELFSALADADPRLTVSSNNITFVNGDVTYSFQNIDNNYLQFDVEGTTWPGWNTELFDGAVVRVGESLFGIGYDSTYISGGWYPAGVVWNTEIQPVSVPHPEEATIDASDIVYWVGNGENEVVMAINWADTALAWGCRFSTATISVADVMDSIANADPRFSYTMDGYLTDILFTMDNGETLSITPGNWWESRHNGVMDAGMIQTLENGDIEKWGDPAAGVVVDSMYYDGYGWSYIYVYPMTIYPVSIPTNGINSVETIDVHFYPNPASAQLQVRFNALESRSEAVLYDMTGRTVYSRTLAAGEREFTLPVSQLANGIYMLRMGDSAVKVAVRH